MRHKEVEKSGKIGSVVSFTRKMWQKKKRETFEDSDAGAK